MNSIPYKVIRSDRKSIALVIDNEAYLVIRAPHNTKDKEIADFVDKKRHWIIDKQHQVSVFGEKHSPLLIETGESILYLGDTYTLLRDDVSEIKISSTNILIPENYNKENVVTWMKNEASKLLNERVAKYAGLMGITYESVKMSEAKARWGSCSVKNNLNFAWRLIMCPIAVIDYVVVHELSHVTYKNHGPAFWARVKTVLPHYKEQQDWLKVNRKLMEIV
ncbi:MAG: M48 family metallopeptidase [Trichococcus flocculiformis]|uniref:M48 family metallopeptidase n=1 Tax=Trichococcus flocculiformis TaxID=82803 RepID=A0A847D5K3_9LACT|nr:SprT family zinc-dependent metalloprotease [Trichococcus flocculiformis]NLD31948.1 M48 family metallopeptidase [Trichococcus flocculiformis]